MRGCDSDSSQFAQSGFVGGGTALSRNGLVEVLIGTTGGGQVFAVLLMLVLVELLGGVVVKGT